MWADPESKVTSFSSQNTDPIPHFTTAAPVSNATTAAGIPAVTDGVVSVCVAVFDLQDRKETKVRKDVGDFRGL